MSEQITHLAVSDDARRLALASPRVCEAIKSAIEKRLDKMRLGAITQGSEKFAGPVIATLRNRKASPARGDDAKLAFCLGTLAHRAADRMMKPISSAQTADGGAERRDISIYNDIFLFDRLYGRGTKSPYSPDVLSPALPFPSAPGLNVSAVEEYFRALLQRTLLSAHTFKPDYADPEAWLDELFRRLQDFYIDVNRYHKALTEPDQDLIRRAIVDVNFYNDDDRIISLLVDLRAGREVSEADFLKRCYLGDNDSLYARAVSMSYGYIQLASEFWEGKAGEDLFFDAIIR